VSLETLGDDGRRLRFAEGIGEPARIARLEMTLQGRYVLRHRHVVGVAEEKVGDARLPGPLAMRRGLIPGAERDGGLEGLDATRDAHRGVPPGDAEDAVGRPWFATFLGASALLFLGPPGYFSM
jgi:hypothetical protein